MASIDDVNNFSGLVNRAAQLICFKVDPSQVMEAIRAEVGNDTAYLIFVAAQMAADSKTPPTPAAEEVTSDAP